MCTELLGKAALESTGALAPDDGRIYFGELILEIALAIGAGHLTPQARHYSSSLLFAGVVAWTRAD